jgi:ferritin-like metal-binding protein YciE
MADNSYLFTNFADRLVRAGLPGDVAHLVAATKHSPANLGGILDAIADEQAAIEAATAEFRRVEAAVATDLKAPAEDEGRKRAVTMLETVAEDEK